MLLLAALGNPGKEYQNMRHNFGFLALDAWAEKQGATFSDAKKFKSQIAEIKIGADKIVCLKPQTFMNLSGEAVCEAVDFYKIAHDQILVLHDDLDLPLGKLRFARGGSAAGHNGIKSIISCLGSQEFARLKLGIGRPVHPGQAAVDFVLQKFTKDEVIVVDEILPKLVQAIECFINDGLQEAMNRYN